MGIEITEYNCQSVFVLGVLFVDPDVHAMTGDTSPGVTGQYGSLLLVASILPFVTSTMPFFLVV